MGAIILFIIIIIINITRWDSIEDTIVYTIIILGVLVTPTSLLMAASIDCTLCLKVCSPSQLETYFFYFMA